MKSGAGVFIASQTTLGHAALVPEIALYLASEITPIWQATEDHLASAGIEPPFWAFPWPGSQILARHILDHPETVRGRTVLDFACGNGLAGIAAMKAGARHVMACDIDPMALDAVRLNAALNDVTIETWQGDMVGQQPACDLLICGDVCYNQTMAAHILPWLRQCASRHEVWLADPGRSYAPQGDFDVIARCDVPTSLELEDRSVRQTVLCRLHATSSGAPAPIVRKGAL
ncbi:class I SAM-dependent methyltransferase [Brytella acorum]|uniref:50S ribosomal protein L11 methyltransferase n=1 Tax=Brytella acorum TaxID=2959299 RepID=A0AA35VAD5_9PROT|nr:50S ribosomal protein L11 methyltransferase [Brytella acorum]MDF3624166.1 50S ribosomal protein L11 methyltransferase [Brytella acorum]CAI9120672.1 50S ribosomal protein L11 methyltransferase [Brytella acorum]